MQIMQDLSHWLSLEAHTTPEKATAKQLYQGLSKAVLAHIMSDWQKSQQAHRQTRHAYYLSAEYLLGRAIFNNLYALDLLDSVKEAFAKENLDWNLLEEIEDDALGNGGLGRLAACFLDSAATTRLPLDGYGIRYQYGLFRQTFEDGFQIESPDDWQQYGDPWSVRREDEAVTVEFADQKVRAVPYDMPILGYRTDHISTLRLWQSEPIHQFDLPAFDAQKYGQALQEKNNAEILCSVLYPNDSTTVGKKLRLKQQYFLCSASLQDVLRQYKNQHGNDFSAFAKTFALQLNDTHPVLAIPECIRLLMNQGFTFEEALGMAGQIFSYTNHTVMAEAMETWSIRLFRSVLPHLYDIVLKLHHHLKQDFKQKGFSLQEIKPFQIIENNRIHMARMAIYVTHTTNGVAKLHTQILKNTVLNRWYQLYPERFQNKTNGITPRRWLGLCNPELTAALEEWVGQGFLTDLTKLTKLEEFAEHEDVLERLHAIKQTKKEQLADWLSQTHGITVDASFLFDVQVKRLHEYKRQLLNAFSILDFYFRIKDGELSDFTPTLYLFGAKAASGYFRAKAVIKLIHEIGRLVASDPVVSKKMQVVFVPNYSVSAAEKIMPAADVSEQISTAGTEASGTGNMKLMLNGAVTLGTYDGANVEIVAQAGMENNFIFGARVEEIEACKQSYRPMDYYEHNPRIRRIMDALVDGTLDDQGTGMFKELYDAILKGADWHAPDHYFLLLDFESYTEKKLQTNREYRDTKLFTQKALHNIANAGVFSSDRTILEYGKEIWDIEPLA